jgi:hypothetical protein
MNSFIGLAGTHGLPAGFIFNMLVLLIIKRVWTKFQTSHWYVFFNGYIFFSRVRIWDDKIRWFCTRCRL